MTKATEILKAIEELKAERETLKGAEKGKATKKINQLEKDLASLETEPSLLDEIEEATLEAEEIEEVTVEEMAETLHVDLTEVEEIQPAHQETSTGFDLLKAFKEDHDNMTKTARALTSDKNKDIENLITEMGLHALRGTPKADAEGTYYINLHIPTEGYPNHSDAYKALKKNLTPTFVKHTQEAGNGEMILLTLAYQKTFMFIKPNKDLELKGNDSRDIDIVNINPDNWDEKPVGAFKNGGRATKFSKLIAAQNLLYTDYARRETDKYQRTNIANPHWIVLDLNDNDEMVLVTRNGNKVALPGEVKDVNAVGFGPLIEWAQERLG